MSVVSSSGLAQRSDLQNYVARGIDWAEAKALVQGKSI